VLHFFDGAGIQLTSAQLAELERDALASVGEGKGGRDILDRYAHDHPDEARALFPNSAVDFAKPVASEQLLKEQLAADQGTPVEVQLLFAMSNMNENATTTALPSVGYGNKRFAGAYAIIRAVLELRPSSLLA